MELLPSLCHYLSLEPPYRLCGEEQDDIPQALRLLPARSTD